MADPGDAHLDLAAHARWAPQLGWIADRHGQVIWLCDRWTRLTGLPTTELAGDGWLELVHADERSRLKEGWDDARRSGTAYEAEFRLRAEDESYVWTLLRAEQEPEGERRWFGTGVDVGQLKEAHARTAASAHDLSTALAQTRRLLEHSHDAVMTFDDDRRCVSMNRSAVTMLGKVPDTVVGRPMETVLGLEGQQLDVLEQAWSQMIVTGHMRIDWPIRSDGADGRILDVSATAHYAPGRHLAILRDVTQERRSQEVLANSETRLRFLLDEIERFREEERRRLASQIHDEALQHLIAARMRMQVASARADAVVPDESVDTLLEEAIRSTKRLMESLAPIHTAERPLDESLANRLRELDDDSALVIDLDVPIVVDEERRLIVTRVVAEAVRNARRHAGPSTIRISGRAEAGRILLQVADDGSGFDAPAEGGAGGPGVGIELMQERIRAIGGGFKIESAPDAGTTVTISLPVG
ncbi:MAG: two-component hybrid sensor and regulator [Thermoleophilia bacterium]|nr:two-component hybrid sensor and regulator [Thermoleophilia bacterium]